MTVDKMFLPRDLRRFLAIVSGILSGSDGDASSRMVERVDHAPIQVQMSLLGFVLEDSA